MEQKHGSSKCCISTDYGQTLQMLAWNSTNQNCIKAKIHLDVGAKVVFLIRIVTPAKKKWLVVSLQQSEKRGSESYRPLRDFLDKFNHTYIYTRIQREHHQVFTPESSSKT